MLFSKLLLVVGCTIGLAAADRDPKIHREIFDENDLADAGGDEDIMARMKERREYMESRREEADSRRHRDRRGANRDEIMADRESFLASKKEELANRYRSGDRHGLDHGEDIDMGEMDHHASRKKMEEGMADRHNDMLLRRAERYRTRAEKATSLSDEERTEINGLIEQYIAKEKDMMDSRLSAKSDRMRPSGDMRDPEVKEKFKADLRRSIDERKEKDKAARDEVRELRHRLEEMLNAHPRADLR